MSLHFLSNMERVGFLAAAAVLAAVALVASWRGGRGSVVVAASVLAAASAGVVLAEQIVLLTVRAAAPDAAGFNEYRWVLLAPWGRLGLIAGVATTAVVIALGWWTSARAGSPLQRAALMILRCAAAGTALVLFLQPAVELRQVAREPNHVALLVDDSRSMTLAEVPGGPRRIERARALLVRSAAVLEAWRAEHRIDVFRFAETMVPSSINAVRGEEPRGEATRMRQALEQARTRYEGRDLAGMVLISDGVATGGFADGTGAGSMLDFLQSLDTPVHTAWVGRRGLKDVAIARVLADELAFVRTVVRVEAVIRATGYDERRIQVTLSSEGKAIRQKWVDIGPGVTEVPVAFELTPPRVGKYVYEITTPVAEDEAVDTNNRRSFVLRVIRDKIRVLQVAGEPSWDVHALRRMLEQNPNVDLISFFILRTQDDHSAVNNSEMSLIPFPTQELFQEELPSFDLIVMQNFNFGPYGIGAYLENIRSYVEGGGGLVMLGGALSFSSGGYAGTPVAATLPVELLPNSNDAFQSLAFGRADRRGADPLVDTGMFSPALTKAGAMHPITMLRYERDDNEATWAALPQLEGVNLVARAREDAVVLAAHPTLRTRDGDAMPVMVAGEYRDGRVLAVTTDSLWRWGFVAAGRPGNDGRQYVKLWENAIRWLIQDPDLRHLHVEADAVTYDPGTPVRLDVRLMDRDYTPLEGGEVSLRVRRGSDPEQPEAVDEAVITVDAAGRGRHEMAGLEPGVYRVEAEARVGERKVRAKDIFVVRDAGVELEQPAADEALLQAIAAATGGTYLGEAEALPADLAFDEPRIVRVDHRADVELWSRPALLFLALLFLGIEWGLRQRSGYL